MRDSPFSWVLLYTPLLAPRCSLAWGEMLMLVAVLWRKCPPPDTPPGPAHSCGLWRPGSMEVMESSDISITDCWNSLGTSPLPGPWKLPLPGTGVWPPTVP